MKQSPLLLLVAALILQACTVYVGRDEEKKLPTEVVLHGREYLQLPSQYPQNPKEQKVNLAPVVVTKMWELPLGTNPITKAHYQEGYVFITTATNLLYVVTAATGEINWISNTPVQANFPVGLTENRVYYAAGDAIYEADFNTGKVLNVQRTLQNISIPANGVGYGNENLFVMSTTGNIQGHKLTGEIGENWLAKVPTWIYRPMGYLTGPLLVESPNIFISHDGGKLIRMSTISGGEFTLEFKRSGFRALHPPIISDDLIYQTFDDNTLYAINRHSMLTEWSYPMGIPRGETPVLGSQRIAISLVKGIDVIDTKGNEVYSTQLVKTPIAFAKNSLIGITYEGKTVALDPMGKVLWTEDSGNEGERITATEGAYISITKDRSNIALFATGKVRTPRELAIDKNALHDKAAKAPEKAETE